MKAALMVLTAGTLLATAAFWARGAGGTGEPQVGRFLAGTSNASACAGYDTALADTDLAGSLLRTVPGGREQCCAACDATPRCGGWVWVSDACYLKADLTGTMASAGRLAAVRSMPGHCGGYSQARDSTDLSGVLLTVKFGSSPAACCSACGNTTGCEGFSYFEQRCYLKGALIGTFYSPGRVSRLRVRSGGCQGYSTAKNDTDVAGTLLKTKPASSAGECCSACGDTTGCGGFSYFDRLCYLKGPVTGTFHNAGRVSRLKLPLQPLQPLQPLPPSNCSGFSAEAGVHLAGPLLAMRPVQSNTSCCAVCDAQPGCTAIVRVADVCYLKANITGAWPRTNATAWLRLAPTNCTGFSDPTSNTDLAGHLLATRFGASEAGCCAECRGQRGCGGFSYFQHQCYLKGNVSGTFAMPGRVTRLPA